MAPKEEETQKEDTPKSINFVILGWLDNIK